MFTSNILVVALFGACSILALLQTACGQANLGIHGCSGRNFKGTCHDFSCPYQSCCRLPAFFQNRLVSVRATGKYNVRLFTSAGCNAHCNDNDDQSRFVDHEGWKNIGAASYACVDGPF